MNAPFPSRLRTGEGPKEREVFTDGATQRRKNKGKEGRLDDIIPCIGCHEGCIGRVRKYQHLGCAVNPTTGVEKAMAIHPAIREKSVLVIGGGPAGMEAARICALKGHAVTLWEKNNALGGNLIPAAVPDFD